MSEQKSGCLQRFVWIIILLTIIGAAISLFSGPKIKGDTAYVKINLWYQGAAKNVEWAEKIWKGAQNEKVENIIVICTAEYNDKYGHTEKYKYEIDITDLLSPLSEVRRYTKSEFANEFGDYIISVVSIRMSAKVP